MTDAGIPATYRYVSDGQMAVAVNRDAMARVNLPVAGFVSAVVAFGVGFYASFDSNRASLPADRGEVLGIALVWGLAFSAIWVAAEVVALVVARAVNRHRMGRLFPAGSVTEVRLEQDALVLTRPATTRSIPYDRIRRVRQYQHTHAIVVRGRPFVEELPAGLLPDQAVEILQARASGAVPLSWSTAPTGPVRRRVVPDGWAAHVAAITVRATLSTPRFRVRLGLALLASAVIAYAAGAAWFALGPALALISVTSVYLRTRRAMAAATPTGSVASLEVLDDRLVSRTARWSRDIRFDEVQRIDMQGDVLFLVMTSVPRRLAIARELVPDQVIERLRAGGPAT